MTLLPDRPQRLRIAVFARYSFPLAAAAESYAELDAAAAALGAEYRVFHSVVTDPSQLPEHVRGRVGGGLLVPWFEAAHEHDLAHFRRTLPAGVLRVLAKLSRFSGADPATILARREVHEAFSFARWARAWHADVVLSDGWEEGSLQAWVTAELLALPRVAHFGEATGAFEYGQLVRLHVEQAHALVAGSERARDELGARFGAAAARATMVARAGETGAAVLAQAVQHARCAAAGNEPAPRGPQVAFVTAASAVPSPPPGKRFLVLGAERTGSTMLVAMLGSVPGFACAGELFNPRLIAAGAIDWLPSSRLPREDLLALRGRAPGQLLANLWRDGAAAGAHHVGFKLLYTHALHDDRIVDALAADRELIVVHLLRADRLQRCLSLAKATASDQWGDGGAPGAAAPREPVALDPQQLATQFTLDELLEERYRAVFRGHAGLELDYEDLAQRLEEAARRLGGVLGTDLGQVVPRTRKTGSRDVAGSIANLAALRAAFAATRWASLLP